MEENYLLSVIGTQFIDGDADKVELKTVASYIKKNGNHYITYKEYDAENIRKNSHTTIKISSDNIITIIKGGDEHHNLTLEKGKRHKCEYITPFGNILLGVYTDKVNIALDDKGGEIEAEYSIDMNSKLASTNKLFLKLEEANKNVNINTDNK